MNKNRNNNSKNSKITKRIIMATSFVLLLLTINRYRAGYLTDYIKEEDFTSLHMIKFDIRNDQSQEFKTKDQKQIQEIYNYIADQKIRRQVKWGMGLNVGSGITYDLHLITGSDEPNHSLSLIGDEYIILYHPYDGKSITFRYVDGNIDLECFEELITD